MLRNSSRALIAFISLASAAGMTARAQSPTAPRVVVPANRQAQATTSAYSSYSGYAPARPGAPLPVKYPWRTFVTSTIFWVGEQPTQNNPTPNCKSSWDTQWAVNFGGYDDPNPENRVADRVTGDYRPKKFIPKLNPFYVALPYNDVLNYREHKPEASRAIPWFAATNPLPGKTVCKGRWIQIFINKTSCFAQWEDCGPWTTDDHEYVFGNKPPKVNQNGSAGIDLSPSVRDYLGIKSGTKVHWRFVDVSQVPNGPWRRYGNSPAPVIPESPQPDRVLARVGENEDLEAQRRYMDNLRRLRDQEFLRKPLQN